MKIKRTLLLLVALLALTPAFGQKIDSEVLKGLQLRHIGPGNMSGRVVDMAVLESNPYVIYAATATGGLWHTDNNGVTWKPIFENEATHSIGAIALHQKHPKHIWVGTGERASRQSSGWGDGVYKSSDGGKTWANMGLKDSHHVGRIVTHPTDTNTVYVAAMGHLWGSNNERGLYKTTDGGENWERIIYVNDDTGVSDIAMDPSDPNTLYAATYQRRRRPYGFHGGGPGSGLHKSTDGGKTWKELRNGLPEGDYGRIGISIYRNDPNLVYISVEQGFQYNASTAYTKREAGMYRSMDKGENWEYLSNWNPRPMYASQPLVDPSDASRIYMMNQFSYSSDSGRTFKAARQSLHGDDRILWVNPKDSRHVIKGDDGGIGISYDRAKTWLFVTNLPVSQLYRVSVDMAKPYNVYGGLQDNGSWVGPNETYRSDGILNGDWRKTGGGDGFLTLAHHTEEGVIYGESQYLGLFKLDLNTGQRQSLRPGDPQGRIGARRNWTSWGPGTEDPELGNAMAPGNWDGPFFLSYHDPNTIYAGTNILWKSTDGGSTWTSLGDQTTEVNRRELLIMGQRADENTASLDDGIPYYPTLTAVAESRLKQGMLYVGTDDGLLKISSDDGKTWTDVTSRLSGLPKETWINTIETSSHAAGTAYVAINNYRNDDFNNYVYKTTDFGQSWQSVTGDLPANRVARTLREDPKNPNLLYLGTEIGFFISLNGGKNWTELKNNMPTVAFNDLTIHPRDNDLILATHGRGVWILDNLNALQELSTEVMDQGAALFNIPTAERINYTREGAHVGDMYFRGTNPLRGAIIDYYLKDFTEKEDVSLSIFDMDGNELHSFTPDRRAGIHRVTWNLNNNGLNSGKQRLRGNAPPVTPGLYMAKLTVKGTVYEKQFNVVDDPRLEVSIADRNAWTANLEDIFSLYKTVNGQSNQMRKIRTKLNKVAKEYSKISATSKTEVEEMSRLYGELVSRVRGLYGQVYGWTGRMTTDQNSQFAFYKEMQNKLSKRMESMMKKDIPKLNRVLKGKDKITTEE